LFWVKQKRKGGRKVMKRKSFWGKKGENRPPDELRFGSRKDIVRPRTGRNGRFRDRKKKAEEKPAGKGTNAGGGNKRA